MIVCYYEGLLGTKTWVLVRALSLLNSGAISPEPFKVFFLLYAISATGVLCTKCTSISQRCFEGR